MMDVPYYLNKMFCQRSACPYNKHPILWCTLCSSGQPKRYVFVWETCAIYIYRRIYRHSEQDERHIEHNIQKS